MTAQQEVFNAITKRNNTQLDSQVTQYLQRKNTKIIVLDDDSTGVQTLHDIPVLTQWSKELLYEQFVSSSPIFYVLTNIRSKSEHDSRLIIDEITTFIALIARETNISYTLISRSDSTLRGHYPLDVITMSDAINHLNPRDSIDGHLILPMLFEDGRVTYENTHYLLKDKDAIPLSHSEFAKDHIFGYHSANLINWVVEKSKGFYQPEDCLVISIDDLDYRPNKIKETLLKAQNNQPIIVNATNYHDLDVLIDYIIQVENLGKRFIYRSGASFIKAYADITDKDFLQKDDVITKDSADYGGLIIVGSIVENTTTQINYLKAHTDNLVTFELDITKILIPAFQASEIVKLSTKVNHYLELGKNVMIYTSRNKVTVANQDSSINLSQMISHQLINIIKSLSVLPKYVIAKGGNTASDIIINGFEIKLATIIGQISYGIPVWLSETGTPIIVFPGNVGTKRTLAEIVNFLA